MSVFTKTVRSCVKNYLHDKSIDISHDIYHLDRVCKNALLINRVENGNKNRKLVIIASYLHDFHRLYDLQSKKKFNSVEDSLYMIEDFFRLFPAFSQHKKSVKKIILNTDKFSFLNNRNEDIDIYGKIISDADNLDAIGAIGISRAFSFGQWINEPIYVPFALLDTNKFNPEANSISVIHHFYEKLLKMEGEFYTMTAKNIAKGRIDFMKKYLEIFLKEINNEL